MISVSSSSSPVRSTSSIPKSLSQTGGAARVEEVVAKKTLAAMARKQRCWDSFMSREWFGFGFSYRIELLKSSKQHTTFHRHHPDRYEKFLNRIIHRSDAEE